jgi:geranylgeranyl diphosphate synthase type II
VDVQAYLAERTPLVDEVLERLLPDPAESPTALHAAMRHLVFPGGKRLRPALAMAGAEAVGSAPERALPLAAAVELVHSYSLIHDDLPCMDDDATRRGRPTVHVAFGEAVAVLAGDALQSLAFEALAPAANANPDELQRSVWVMRDLAVAIGATGLVGGQVDDLAFFEAAGAIEPAGATEAAGKADAHHIESIHLRKTAALIAVSIVGGARLGGGDAETLVRLGEFGRRVGLAFQIADDLLDEDEDEGCSLLRLVGPEVAYERAESLLSESLAMLEGLGEPAEPLRELARFAVRRKV